MQLVRVRDLVCDKVWDSVRVKRLVGIGFGYTVVVCHDQVRLQVGQVSVLEIAKRTN